MQVSLLDLKPTVGTVGRYRGSKFTKLLAFLMGIGKMGLMIPSTQLVYP